MTAQGPTRNRQRTGWVRLRGGCGGVWLHESSGWEVKHCGHPTALWPYYGVPSVEIPATAHVRASVKLGQFTAAAHFPILIAPNGYAFRLLNDAQAAVEEALDRFLEEWNRLHPS
jgi:hypothetical protein